MKDVNLNKNYFSPSTNACIVLVNDPSFSFPFTQDKRMRWRTFKGI